PVQGGHDGVVSERAAEPAYNVMHVALTALPESFHYRSFQMAHVEKSRPVGRKQKKCKGPGGDLGLICGPGGFDASADWQGRSGLSMELEIPVGPGTRIKDAGRSFVECFAEF